SAGFGSRRIFLHTNETSMKQNPLITAQPKLVREQLLFGLLLGFEILHVLWLIVQKRMLIGYDGFQYFSLQYFFLNDSAINHEIPLWIPYVSQGEPSNWWYTIQGT